MLLKQTLTKGSENCNKKEENADFLSAHKINFINKEILLI